MSTKANITTPQYYATQIAELMASPDCATPVGLWAGCRIIGSAIQNVKVAVQNLDKRVRAPQSTIPSIHAAQSSVVQMVEMFKPALQQSSSPGNTRTVVAEIVAQLSHRKFTSHAKPEMLSQLAVVQADLTRIGTNAGTLENLTDIARQRSTAGLREVSF